jgi:protein SCO1/2
VAGLPAKSPFTWLIGLGLAGLTLAVLLFWTALQGSRAPLPVYGQVADFGGLTNQLGAPVSLENLRGQVWVADVIFSRCPMACPGMTLRMGELQVALPPKAQVKLLSLTTDPENDTPAVLKRYAEQFGANPDRWWLLTGPEDKVRHALTNSLKLSAIETPPALRTNQFDLYTHSTLFVVVDKQSRIRAAIESSEPGWKKRILHDINRLLHEG